MWRVKGEREGRKRRGRRSEVGGRRRKVKIHGRGDEREIVSVGIPNY